MPSPPVRGFGRHRPAARSSLQFHRALTPAERSAQLLADARSYERRRIRRLASAILGCVGSCAVGLYLIGLGMHLADPGLAEIAFWGGLAVGNGGMLVTLLLAYLDAVENGDL